MKSFILLAVLALAAAESTHYGLGSYKYEVQGENGLHNAHYVPEYITYQILEAKQMGFTAPEFASFLVKNQYPEFVAKYFADQFDFLYKQPFGSSPYHIFEYYYKEVIPKEVEDFILSQISKVYQLYYQINGVEDINLESVLKPIVQYVLIQGNYYSNGLTYEQAEYGFDQLFKSEEYVFTAMKTLEKVNVPKEIHDYLVQQLKQGLHFVENAKKMFVELHAYKTHYVPYYYAQHVFGDVQKVLEYFHKAYEFVQKQQVAGYWPQTAFQVLEQVESAYKVAEKAYNIFKKSEYGQFYHTYYTFPYGYEHASGKFGLKFESKPYPSMWFNKFEALPSTHKFYGQYAQEFHKPSFKYIAPQQYGYHQSWKSFNSYYPEEYKPYQYGFSGEYKTLKSYKPHQPEEHKPYQYGFSGQYKNVESVKPYHSEEYKPYQFGFSGEYKNLESYKPHQPEEHKPYHYGFSGQYINVESVAPHHSEEYKPYQFGFSGQYKNVESVKPYHSEEYKPYQFVFFGKYKNWESHKPHQPEEYKVHQSGYPTEYKTWESYKPYQYGYFNKNAFPYGHKYSEFHVPVVKSWA